VLRLDAIRDPEMLRQVAVLDGYHGIVLPA